MNWMSKKLLILLLFMTPLLIIAFGPSHNASAVHIFDPVCTNGNVQGGNNKESPVCKDSKSAQGNDANDNVVLRIIKAGANVIAFLAGAAAIIMIIVAGFSFVTSGGNSEKTANARRRIVGATIGLVIIALAWAITRFITGKVL